LQPSSLEYFKLPLNQLDNSFLQYLKLSEQLKQRKGVFYASKVGNLQSESKLHSETAGPPYIRVM